MGKKLWKCPDKTTSLITAPGRGEGGEGGVFAGGNKHALQNNRYVENGIDYCSVITRDYVSCGTDCHSNAKTHLYPVKVTL